MILARVSKWLKPRRCSHLFLRAVSKLCELQPSALMGLAGWLRMLCSGALSGIFRVFSYGLLVVLLLHWVYGGAIMLLFVLLAFGGLLYFVQDSLLYHPEHPEHARLLVYTPNVYSLPYENIYFSSVDGVRLHGYFIKQSGEVGRQAPTVLFLHGNAGNIGHRISNAAAMFSTCSSNVFLLEWRGYGHSEGIPSEQGLFLDAQAALDLLLARDDIDIDKIVVHGRSLGGAVASRLCSHPAYAQKIFAVLIENSFISIPAMASVLFHPLLERLPKWMYRNQFNSIEDIEEISAPTLFLSGNADNLVPPWMMRRLFESCGARAKRMETFPQGGHNDTWTCEGYCQTICQFFAQAAVLRCVSLPMLVNSPTHTTAPSMHAHHNHPQHNHSHHHHNCRHQHSHNSLAVHTEDLPKAHLSTSHAQTSAPPLSHAHSQLWAVGPTEFADLDESSLESPS